MFSKQFSVIFEFNCKKRFMASQGLFYYTGKVLQRMPYDVDHYQVLWCQPGFAWGRKVHKN